MKISKMGDAVSKILGSLIGMAAGAYFGVGWCFSVRKHVAGRYRDGGTADPLPSEWILASLVGAIIGGSLMFSLAFLVANQGKPFHRQTR